MALQPGRQGPEFSLNTTPLRFPLLADFEPKGEVADGILDALEALSQGRKP